jgi:hypothetical protein
LTNAIGKILTAAATARPTGSEEMPCACASPAYPPTIDDGGMMLNANESRGVGEMLTPREAFLVMSDFIWNFAQRAGDDLLTLIGDTDLMKDGMPVDPAAWSDWLTSVALVKSGRAPRAEA